MTQYISRKSDAKSKPPTQVLTADKWITVEAENEIYLTAAESSKAGALYACYLNIQTPKIGGATELTLRWIRDPKGIADATGYETKSLKRGGTTFIKDVWLFQAKKGQPIALQVKVNGKATITTRETKLAIS